jgi:IclR family transcriptional regulator, KDG regulon repressor
MSTLARPERATLFRLEKLRFVYYTARGRRWRLGSAEVKDRTRRRAAPQPRGIERGDGLQSLQTAFRILDELSNAHGPVALSDLAARLGELKPRVYRHLSTMKRLGVVFQEERNGGYSLGSRLFTLGEAALEQFDLRLVADPYLTRLRDETQQTALLSVPGNGEPVVVGCVEYRDRLSISSRPGNRAPPHCSSQGRVALAFGDPAATARLLAHKLTPFTRHSITDRTLIEARLKEVREQFYEYAADEVRLGITAVSAPLFRDAAEFIGIIGIVGTSAEIGAPPERSQVATLHRVAGALSAELNCRIYYQRNLVR